MQSFWQDARYGVRMLLKTPGFTFIAVLAMALGIGANTTIFSCLNALVIRPLSFENQDRMVMVWESAVEASQSRNSASAPNFLDWRSRNRVFEEMAAYSERAFNLTDGDNPERVEGTQVTPGFFNVLGVRAERGRTFTAEEGEVGREQVMVLKHSFWQRRFGADPDVVGRTLTLNGLPYTIVGIMPAGFDYPQGGSQIWIPLAFTSEQQNARGSHFLRVMGFLKPGVTMSQAQTEMKEIARGLAEQYPVTNTGRSAYIETLAQHASRGSRRYLEVLMGAVIFVLLIACANVANLLLARGASRQKEIAVRMALGASRMRLVRQLLTESLLIALAGGALGLLFSVWGIEFISRGIPPTMTKYITGWQKLGIDLWVFTFTLIISIVTGIIFGIIPALQATKTNLNESLKEGSRTSGSGAVRNRLRSLLVVSEMALSLVLLIGAGLMIRSFIELVRIDPGFNPSNILTMEMGLTRSKYQTEEQRINFYKQLLERIQTLPGVEQASAVNYLPASGSSTGSSFSIEGQPEPERGKEPVADYRVVTTRFFDAMGIALHKGRLFTEQDTKETPRVIIINQTLARRFFPEEDPIGKRLSFDKEEAPWEIIGVAGDVKREDLEDEAVSGVYVPYLQSPWWTMSLAVRSKSDPKLLASTVQSEIRALDRDQPVYNVRTMEEVMDERLSPKRLSMYLLGFFAATALILAAVGLYAVISYSVTQRTHEIGVRMALGAQPSDILRMMVSHGLMLVFTGIALGLVGAFALTRIMAQILYGVTATDPITFIGLPLLLCAVALVASFIPARRATRVDPMVALRYE